MRLPKAKQLNSGKWRIQIQIDGRHTMRDKEDEFGDLIDRKMEELYNS